MNTLKITRKEAQPFLTAAGIDYTGRKFKIEFTEKVYFHNTNWDGGSKNEYAILNMETSGSKTIIAPAPWNNPIEGASAEMQPGIIIIEHCFFCGQDMGVCIYAHPSQAPKLLS